MHQNETRLTPVFRYIITSLEENEKINNNEYISEIKKFIDAIRECNEVFNSGKMPDTDEFILNATISLLEQTEEDRESAELFWQEKKAEIEKQQCENCQICKNCRLYFWNELGSVLFKIENQYKLDKPYVPLRVLPGRIYKHLVPSANLREIYQNKSRFKRDNLKDYILILKGMSSSTPSILNSVFDTDEFDGGGLYINYHGIGIVIDPGYHFVRNLHHHGLNVLDIDLVIITHEHIDHNNDMRLIDDLNATVSNNHKIVWLMDEVSYNVAKIYQKSETGFSQKSNLLIKIKPQSEKRLWLSDFDGALEKIDNLMQFVFFKTEHIFSRDKVVKDHTFGCRITFLEDSRCLVYTSDTRYHSGILKELKYADIVIANISGVYEDDYMLVKPKERHLGYYGCFSILKDCYTQYDHSPQLFMISEFWNGQNDIRYDVAKQMQENIINIGINETRIVPAEKGMYVQISDAHLRCNQCGRFCGKYIIKRPSTLSDVVKVICSECYYE